MTSKLHLVQGEAAYSGDPIAAIQAKLRKYPQARVESSPTRVTVFPLDATGFEVSFTLRPPGCLVCCEGWHERIHRCRVGPGLLRLCSVARRPSARDSTVRGFSSPLAAPGTY